MARPSERSEFRFLISQRVPSGSPIAAHRHVGVDPQRALLHLAVGHTGGHEDRAQLGDVLAGLVRGAQVGAAHDLEQRHAGTVVVDGGVAGARDAATAAHVGRLARVLFEMGPLDADLFARGELERSLDVDGLVVLRDLEVLRHVGIEVVLPGEHRRLHRAVEGQPRRIASSTAFWLSTGREPGRPSDTGSTLVLGSLPKRLGAAENILVAVASSACTSSPMTVSHSSSLMSAG